MFAFRLYGKCAAKLQNYPETAILSLLILYIFADLAQKLFSCNHHLADGLDGPDVHRADALICLLKFLLHFFCQSCTFWHNTLVHCNLSKVVLCFKVTLSYTSVKQLVLPSLPATFRPVTRRLSRPKQLVLLGGA